MRMAANQFCADVFERVGDVEMPFVVLDLREEDALEQQVPDLTL